MNLVVVESPAKGNTIKKILGSNFEVLASFGHVRDLPQSKIGVDVKDNFKPEYVIPPKAKKVIKTIKDKIAKAENIYLATDYDREGEAIAWHIIQATGLSKAKAESVKRITFHEITKPAVTEAIKHPRAIDISLVDAQQARRVLDRLVGYKLSPFLWQKVARGLSAGRVQSVAVRLIVDREKEIKDFKPEEYWQILAMLSKNEDKRIFKAVLIEENGKKIEKLTIKSKDQSESIVKDLEGADYLVKDIKTTQKLRTPSAPFTTSTMQQEAARRFSFSAKKTMKIAQDLYEDGLITYMRTDSVQVSEIAKRQAKEIITREFGAEYSLEKPRFYKTKTRGAQEAHEAIRPTNLEVKATGHDNDHNKLYDAIRKRMLASQMKEAIFDETQVKIGAGQFIFQAVGAVLKFDGFLKLYSKSEDTPESEQRLPELAPSEKLALHELQKNQNFTEPPARFTEGTLIKELEKIKNDGYATSFEEIFPNCAGIAVPIRNYFCPVALDILGPSIRLAPKMMSLLPEMLDSADRISKKLLSLKDL